MSVEQRMWSFFKAKGLNDFGIAGLMGNLRAESGLNPKNLQNSYQNKIGHTDETYTISVDNGSYTNFVHDSAGYGLAQWTFWSRKQNLLNFAKSTGKSIGDLDMQMEFAYKELSEGYKTVLNALKNAKSVLDASNAVLLHYENPEDQSSAVQARRARYGQEYYDMFAGKEVKEDKKEVKSEVKDVRKNKSISTSKLESMIEKIEKQIDELKKSQFDEEIYTSRSKMNEIEEKISELEKELEELEEEYLSR